LTDFKSTNLTDHASEIPEESEKGKVIETYIYSRSIDGTVRLKLIEYKNGVEVQYLPEGNFWVDRQHAEEAFKWAESVPNTLRDDIQIPLSFIKNTFQSNKDITSKESNMSYQEKINQLRKISHEVPSDANKGKRSGSYLYHTSDNGFLDLEVIEYENGIEIHFSPLGQVWIDDNNTDEAFEYIESISDEIKSKQSTPWERITSHLKNISASSTDVENQSVKEDGGNSDELNTIEINIANLKDTRSFCAIGLLVFFFMPWISSGVVSLAGYQVVDLADRVNQFISALGQVRGVSLETKAELNLLYLLYLIPISSILSIISKLRGKTPKLSSYTAATIPLLSFFYILFKNGSMIFDFLSIGAYLTLITAIVLMFELRGYIGTKSIEIKTSKD